MNPWLKVLEQFQTSESKRRAAVQAKLPRRKKRAGTLARIEQKLAAIDAGMEALLFLAVNDDSL